MADREENRIRNFIRHIRHKSVWQVLGTYVIGSWGVLTVVGTMTSVLDLPDWFASVALGFLLLGFPFVLATAFIQARDLNERTQGSSGTGSDTSGLSLWK